MIYGSKQPGPDLVTLDAGSVYLIEVGDPLTDDLIVGSLIAFLDGLGGGAGEQRLRPLVMEQGDVATATVGDEIVIAEGAQPGWVHLTFAQPPRLRADRVPILGLVVGPTTGLTRLYGAAGSIATTERLDSPYAGPLDLSGGQTDVELLASVVAVGVTPWRAPVLTLDEYAALPLHVAQDALGSATSGTVGDPVDAVAGWHYDPDDPPLNASAIARTGGPLAELVGERLRVVARTPYGDRSVVVVLTDERDFDDELAGEDLSLARGAFERIGDLWTDALTVTVEVLS